VDVWIRLKIFSVLIGINIRIGLRRHYCGASDSLAICHPSGCTVASGVVVVVGVCNRSQMRTSKFTCLIFGVSIVLSLARNAQNEFLIGHSLRSHATYRRHLWMASSSYFNGNGAFKCFNCLI